MKWLKGALKSRTIWFSVFLAVMGVVEASSGAVREIFVPIFGGTAVGVILILVSIGVAVLRVLTTVPMEEK